MGVKTPSVSPSLSPTALQAKRHLLARGEESPRGAVARIPGAVCYGLLRQRRTERLLLTQ